MKWENKMARYLPYCRIRRRHKKKRYQTEEEQILKAFKHVYPLYLPQYKLIRWRMNHLMTISICRVFEGFDYWFVERHRFPSSIPDLTNLTTVADSCLVRATKTVAHRVHHSPLTTDRGRITNLVLGHKTLYSCPASISLLKTRSFPFIFIT